MLTAIVSGVTVGVLAVTTIGSMNEESAAARRKTVALLSASGTFAKNVEAFAGASPRCSCIRKRPTSSTRAWRRTGG